MKKTFKIEDLDCANCAAKIEKAISAIDGVKYAAVSFMAQRLILEADDSCFNEILALAVKAAHKVDPDCNIIVK